MKYAAVLTFVLFAVCAVLAQSDPSFDHQTTTYYAKYQPVSVTNANMEITTYFSPDHSIDTLTYFIDSATTSVDIGAPGFSSWSGCSNGTDIGCPISFVRNQEQFPIFQALLNAIYRGVSVRILTVNYNTPVADGMIDPLTFLAVAGANVRYYTTTTFLHTKYMNVDQTAVSVSSVNYDYTSYMENREAGMILSGSGAQPLVSYLNNVYTYDFNKGGQYPVPTYNQSDINIIKNPNPPVAIVIPPPRPYSGAYVTSVNNVSATFASVQVIASPDYAWTTLSAQMNASTTSLSIYVYQIFGGMCDIVQDLYSNGITITLLVSDTIFSYDDWKSAQACYKTLDSAGITVRQTARHMYKYSHQKFWIIDGKTVGLSTGNLSPTDYPEGPNTYPPFSSGSWRDINRDYTVVVQSNAALVAVYQNVLQQDYAIGHDYSPYDVSAPGEFLGDSEFSS